MLQEFIDIVHSPLRRMQFDKTKHRRWVAVDDVIDLVNGGFGLNATMLRNHIIKYLSTQNNKESEKMKCYGCDKEIERPYKRMRCENERERQPFCKECATNLMKIKRGMI